MFAGVSTFAVCVIVIFPPPLTAAFAPSTCLTSTEAPVTLAAPSKVMVIVPTPVVAGETAAAVVTFTYCAVAAAIPFAAPADGVILKR